MRPYDTATVQFRISAVGLLMVVVKVGIVLAVKIAVFVVVADVVKIVVEPLRSFKIEHT